MRVVRVVRLLRVVGLVKVGISLSRIQGQCHMIVKI